MFLSQGCPSPSAGAFLVHAHAGSARRRVYRVDYPIWGRPSHYFPVSCSREQRLRKILRESPRAHVGEFLCLRDGERVADAQDMRVCFTEHCRPLPTWHLPQAVFSRGSCDWTPTAHRRPARSSRRGLPPFIDEGPGSGNTSSNTMDPEKP